MKAREHVGVPDAVFCMRVIDWTVEDSTLVCTTHKSNLEITQDAWKCRWDMEPGDRYCIVLNNPDEVQEPNGPIVWRWEDGKITTTLEGETVARRYG